jgi:hypothetical protein
MILIWKRYGFLQPQMIWYWLVLGSFQKVGMHVPRQETLLQTIVPDAVIVIWQGCCISGPVGFLQVQEP